MTVDIPKDRGCIGTHKIIVEVYSEQAAQIKGQSVADCLEFTLKVADDNFFFETIASPGILPFIIIIVVIIIIAAYIKKRKTKYYNNI
jgi:hypothetical protein